MLSYFKYNQCLFRIITFTSYVHIVHTYSWEFTIYAIIWVLFILDTSIYMHINSNTAKYIFYDQYSSMFIHVSFCFSLIMFICGVLCRFLYILSAFVCELFCFLIQINILCFSSLIFFSLFIWYFVDHC